MASDKLLLDKANTTDGTAAGAAVVATVANVTEVTNAAYDLSAVASTAENDAIILGGGNEANADLSAAINGAELLKYLGTTGSAATSITATADGDKLYLVAYDAGNTYLYHALDPAAVGSEIGAANIALVATLQGTQAVVAADFTLY